MTSTQTTEHRFAWIQLHGGPVVTWADPGHPAVAGEGLEGWVATRRDENDEPLRISKDFKDANGLRSVFLWVSSHAQDTVKRVYWLSRLELGEGGRLVISRGSAADFRTAQTAAEGHVHKTRQIGGLTWWCESEDYWVSWSGNFRLVARCDGQVQWRFETYGQAPTLDEAALLASRVVTSHRSAADFRKAAQAEAEEHGGKTRQFGGLTWWCGSKDEMEDDWWSGTGTFELSASRRHSGWFFETFGPAPTLEEAALLASLPSRQCASTAPA